MSALPRTATAKADSRNSHVRFTPNSGIDCVFRHVCFGPIADIAPVATIVPPLNVVQRVEQCMSDRIPRRHVVASLTALGFCGLLPHVRAAHAASSDQTARSLAERLATYADRLRYDDLDATTIERIKSHVIIHE